MEVIGSNGKNLNLGVKAVNLGTGAHTFLFLHNEPLNDTMRK